MTCIFSLKGIPAPRQGWLAGGNTLIHCDKALQNSSVHRERFVDLGALTAFLQTALTETHIGRGIIE